MSCFWHERRVAVTGASGFVGHHLALLLRQQGARVTALVRATSARARLVNAGVTCRTAPLEDVLALTQGCRGMEFLFHVAGAVDFQDHWERLQRSNVIGTRNVLAAARASGVRRLIHTSSIVAVGASPRPGILDENASWNLGRLRIPYVTTKRQAEEAALQASGPELEVVVVNPSCVVGPGDHSHSEFGTLCRRFWRGRIPIHFGGGNNYVDVRDVALGHLLAAQRGRPGDRYLLTGTNRSSRAFFADLARTSGRPIARLQAPGFLGPAIAWLNKRLARPSARPYLTAGQAKLLCWYFYFDCAKARRELGYEPRPLHETLRDAYRFWMPLAA